MGPTNGIYCGALTGGHVGAVSKDEATWWSLVPFGAWPLPSLQSERDPRAVPAPDSLIATVRSTRAYLPGQHLGLQCHPVSLAGQRHMDSREGLL